MKISMKNPIEAHQTPHFPGQAPPSSPIRPLPVEAPPEVTGHGGDLMMIIWSYNGDTINIMVIVLI